MVTPLTKLAQVFISHAPSSCQTCGQVVPVVWKEPRKVERRPVALRSPVPAVPSAEVSAEGREMSPKLCCAIAVTCIT